MIELGQHAGFILGAYAGVFGGVVLLIAWTLVERYRVTARLHALGDTRQESTD